MLNSPMLSSVMLPAAAKPEVLIKLSRTSMPSCTRLLLEPRRPFMTEVPAVAAPVEVTPAIWVAKSSGLRVVDGKVDDLLAIHVSLQFARRTVDRRLNVLDIDHLARAANDERRPQIGILRGNDLDVGCFPLPETRRHDVHGIRSEGKARDGKGALIAGLDGEESIRVDIFDRDLRGRHQSALRI